MFLRFNIGLSLGIFLYSVVVLTSHYAVGGDVQPYLPSSGVLPQEVIKSGPSLDKEIKELSNPIVPAESPRRAVADK